MPHLAPRTGLLSLALDVLLQPLLHALHVLRGDARVRHVVRRRVQLPQHEGPAVDVHDGLLAQVDPQHVRAGAVRLGLAPLPRAPLLRPLRGEPQRGRLVLHKACASAARRLSRCSERARAAAARTVIGPVLPAVLALHRAVPVAHGRVQHLEVAEDVDDACRETGAQRVSATLPNAASACV